MGATRCSPIAHRLGMSLWRGFPGRSSAGVPEKWSDPDFEASKVFFFPFFFFFLRGVFLNHVFSPCFFFLSFFLPISPPPPPPFFRGVFRVLFFFSGPKATGLILNQIPRSSQQTVFAEVVVHNFNVEQDLYTVKLRVISGRRFVEYTLQPARHAKLILPKEWSRGQRKGVRRVLWMVAKSVRTTLEQ